MSKFETAEELNGGYKETNPADSKVLKIETEGDLAELARSKIEEMERAEVDFQRNGEEGIKEAIANVKISDEGTNKVGEKIEAIRYKIAGLMKKVLENGRKKAVIMALGMSMFASTGIGEFKEANAGEKLDNPQKAESVLRGEKNRGKIKYDKKLSELKESILKDNFERFVYCPKNKEDIEFLEKSGERNFGSISFKEIEKAFKNGAERFEIIHTHPLDAYPYSSDQKEKIRKGESMPSPMPPSDTDIIGLVQSLEYFKSENKKIDNTVIDPTGKWTIEIDESSDFIKKYKGIIQYINSFWNPEFLKESMSLTDDDLAILKEKSMDKVHPSERMEKLKSDPKTKEISKKIEKNFSQKMTEIIGLSELEKMNDLIVTASEIHKFRDKYNLVEVKDLIKKYIAKCKEMGILVSYEPF